ncbi:MAG: zinc-ribbon domain-containing protein, partial [Erysipelotrichaceae bacterium]|nr:zinc-ribbon domain-containing protein [Erysipelotrichaceae bacterium]
VQRDIYERHEDDYRNIANAKASIYKDSVREMASAVKEGLGGESNVRTVYCKHCGSKIDADSAFCKHCGQKQ